MIFYFSGTGNSKWVAEQIAKQLNKPLANIADEQEERRYQFTDKDIIGIVFPVYAWNAPEIVEKFITKISANGAYTFAVCTCAEEAGHTIRNLSRVLPLSSGYSLKMPNNYIIGDYTASSEAEINEIISAAEERINKICSEIRQKKTVFDVHIGPMAWLKSSIISWGFKKYDRKTERFKVDNDKCTGCGICQANCPVSAIAMENGRPKWIKNSCEICLRCINRCPTCAIDYGKSAGKKRYVFNG